jgi:hypothetical protein
MLAPKDDAVVQLTLASAGKAFACLPGQTVLMAGCAADLASRMNVYRARADLAANCSWARYKRCFEATLATTETALASSDAAIADAQVNLFLALGAWAPRF